MQIRKVESVTFHYAGEIANLNPEDFRKVSTPYTGNSDEDFFAYLSNLGWQLESIANEIEDDQICEEIYKLLDNSLVEDCIIWDSRTKGSIEWYESGVADENKRGGMDIVHTTNE
jgi:hypothetical protein